MPLFHESNIDLELQSFDDDDEDIDERCQGLLIRRTRSYTTRTDTKAPVKTRLSARETTDTTSVNQAIACALKSNPKAFHYTQKHLQFVPPSIQHLAACEALREFDLHGNELKLLPKEIQCLKSVELCNLGENLFSSIPYIRFIFSRK